MTKNDYSDLRCATCKFWSSLSRQGDNPDWGDCPNISEYVAASCCNANRECQPDNCNLEILTNKDHYCDKHEFKEVI